MQTKDDTSPICEECKSNIDVDYGPDLEAWDACNLCEKCWDKVSRDQRKDEAIVFTNFQNQFRR